MLKETLLLIGLFPKDYGNTFRRGGFSFALEAGILLDVISIIGDWNSDTVYLYLHMPVSQRVSAQKQMASHLLSYSTYP